MVHLTDEALMQQVQRGDLDKMRPLFDRYHVRIYNYCLHLSGEREASKDITQEVFYRVLKFRDTYRATTFATWLYAIARNLCYDHHKAKRNSERQIQALRVVRKTDEATAVAPDDLSRLKAAIAELPVGDRELIVMSKYQGMKYREIAAITNSTAGAVRTKTHRALQKLKGIYLKKIQAHEL